MSEKVLENYANFCLAVCSDPSQDLESFIARARELSKTGVNVPLLLTSGIGLASEGGEANEIIKKVFFQGKELTEENIFHLKRELGDILWYWINACNALDLDPYSVIEENVKKLESRYPGGKFNVWNSENRESGDL